MSEPICKVADIIYVRFELKEFEEQSFLNSFYDKKFSKNKEKQIKELKKFVKKWNSKKNLVFVTHYVVISEILDFATSSGEIVITDNNLKFLGSLEIN